MAPRQWQDISLVGREGSDKLDVSAGAGGGKKENIVGLKLTRLGFSRSNWPGAGGHEGPLWSAETSWGCRKGRDLA